LVIYVNMRNFRNFFSKNMKKYPPDDGFFTLKICYYAFAGRNWHNISHTEGVIPYVS